MEDVWKLVLERTGIKDKQNRKNRLKNMLEWYLLTKDLNGLVAECGTWKGASALALSHYGAEVHCFDSFQGFSDKSDKTFVIDVEEVKHNLRETNATLHVGWIPEVFKEAPEGLYKFVHVDVDKYQATKDSFDFFMPKLCKGGVLVCDDYNWVNDAQKAVDEYGVFKIKGTQAYFINE